MHRLKYSACKGKHLKRTSDAHKRMNVKANKLTALTRRWEVTNAQFNESVGVFFHLGRETNNGVQLSDLTANAKRITA